MSSSGKLKTSGITKKTKHPTNQCHVQKRSFKAALSSGDVLVQLENAIQRVRPTLSGEQSTGKQQLLPLNEQDEKVSGALSGFRPVLRQTNSESNLDVRTGVCYKSPQIFLSIRKRHREVPAYFNRLSDEIILSIFKYLPKSSLVRCSKICRRWYRLSKDDSLWDRIDLANNKSLRASHIHRLLNRGVQVIRLAKAELEQDLIDFARVSVCRLQYLDMSMMVAKEPTVIRDILTRCRHLQALSLEHCDLANDHETFVAIGRNAQLKILNMAMCRNLNQQGISYILNGCQKLVELNVSWTGLDQKAVSLACRMLPYTLVRLNFSGCRSNTMCDEDIDNLTDSCSGLIELDVSDCTEITSKSLQMICERLGCLRVLSSSRCCSIDPMAYLRYCRHLSELNIFTTIKEESMPVLRNALKNVHVNRSPFSTIARPTVGIRRSSIWERRTRDC